MQKSQRTQTTVRLCLSSCGLSYVVPGPSKKAKFRKNPSVDTSSLPDREREEEERRERERLRKEWIKKQEDMKNEEFEITYSYWDGSGHRKSVTVCAVLEHHPLCMLIILAV